MTFEQSYLEDFMNNDFINIDLDRFNSDHLTVSFNNTTDGKLLQASQVDPSKGFFNNELYQIISNNSTDSSVSTTPSLASLSSSSQVFTNLPADHFQSFDVKHDQTPEEEFQIKKDIELEPSQLLNDTTSNLGDMISLINDSTNLNYLDYNTSINSSPYDLESISSPVTFHKQSRPQTPAIMNRTITPTIPNQGKPRRNSSVSSHSSSNSSSHSSQNKKNLDSRLSLQKLGEILHTSSIDETIKIEKFILDIFQNELGFPLGYKTWIRDTNDDYRKYLIDELFVRVNKVYPSMTKTLLETVIKRATYSMMQGRLRKERRAANKKRRV